MRDLLEHAPCGFLRVADDGMIRYANQTLGGMLKTEADALVGRHVDRILTPGARIFYQTHVFPMLRAHSSVHEIYLSLLGDDGGDVPVLLNATRRLEGDEGLCDWVAVPMRRRYEFEEQLQAARRDAENANQAKSRLLSIVSHDIRTPLNAMTLGIDALGSEALGPMTPNQRRVLDRVTRAGESAERLVTQLLTYSTLQSHPRELSLEAVSLQPLLEEARGMLEPRAVDSGLRLEVQACPEFTVLADGARLLQVLLNLLTNAIDHTPEGGSVSLACQGGAGVAGFNVRDTGCGIPEDRLEDVFAPFVQLSSPRAAGTGGVGLGLAISSDFVRAMGGELTVESLSGRGSTFRVMLPVPAPADAA